MLYWIKIIVSPYPFCKCYFFCQRKIADKFFIFKNEYLIMSYSSIRKMKATYSYLLHTYLCKVILLRMLFINI